MCAMVVNFVTSLCQNLNQVCLEFETRMV